VARVNQSDPVAAPLPARSAVRLVFDRQFGSLFWGKFIGVAGNWAHNVAAAIVVFDSTGSATAVSIATAAQYLPQVLLSPWTGAWADRGNEVFQMVLGRVLCALGSAILAVYFLFDRHDSGHVVTVIALAASLITGVGFAVGGPSQHAVVTDLARPEELATAITMNSLPMTTARIFGPVIAAVTLTQWGAAVTFGLSAAANVVFVVLLLFARFSFEKNPRHGSESFVDGLRYIRANTTLLVALISVAAVGIASEPAVTLAPSLAHELGGGATLVGHMTLSFGVGGLVGILLMTSVARWARTGVMASVGLVTMGVGLACAAMGHSVWLALFGFGLTGVGFSCGVADLNHVTQVNTARSYLGRVMAMWMLAFIGTRPFSSPMLGAMSDAWTAGVACVITAIGVGLVAIPHIVVTMRNLRRSPGRAKRTAPGNRVS